MLLVVSDLYLASANCLDFKWPLKITHVSDSWGLPESLQHKYILIRKSVLNHLDTLSHFPVSVETLYQEFTPGLLTSAAFWANSFFILAFSMLSWDSLFFLSSSILFLSSSCLCFSISANFPFTLPEDFQRTPQAFSLLFLPDPSLKCHLSYLSFPLCILPVILGT